MVSGTYTYAELVGLAKKHQAGLRFTNSKLYWQSVSHKWYPVDRKGLYWYRGKGRWSKISPTIDMKRKAKPLNKKFWAKHPQMGDYDTKRRL